MSLQDLMIMIFPSVIVGIITAWITVRFSLRKFYSQRWWERKAEAYSGIMEALFNILNNLKIIAISFEEGRSVDAEHDRLSELSRLGFSELNKMVSIGAFVISKNVVDELANLRSRLDEEKQLFPEDYYEWAWRRSDHVSKTLDKVRRFAKSDLNVN